MRSQGELWWRTQCVVRMGPGGARADRAWAWVGMAVLLLAARAHAAQSCDVQVWPCPQHATQGGEPVRTSALFSVQAPTCAAGSGAALREGMQRYVSLMFDDCAGGAGGAGMGRMGGVRASMAAATGEVVALVVRVDACDTPLVMGVDESYTLQMPSVDARGETVASVHAATPYGALRGMEAFSQLLRVESDGEGACVGTVHGPLHIEDAPRFAWRGLLLDTARHFLPLESILRTVDAMSYAALNTLHWHATDAQSFSLEPPSAPALAKGAYSAADVYTMDDVAHVVAYAEARGVRVVMETDMPGHANAWRAGYPEIVVPCSSTNINNNPLDVSKAQTLQVAQALVGDLMDVLPDEFVHLGGDEVVFPCWNTSAIRAYMAEHQIATFAELQGFWTEKMTAFVHAHGRRAVCWEEMFDDNVPRFGGCDVVHVWKDSDTLAAALRAGHDALLSAGFYLNLNKKPYPEHWHWTTWEMLYLVEPMPSGLTPAQEAHMLGGEAAMWGEWVDASNLDASVWPRAAAVAERLWSSADVRDTESALARLSAFRCHLTRRGIPASPLNPGSCS